MIVDRHIGCVCCGYDLFGLEEQRCPECGTAFDPRDWGKSEAPSPPRQPVRLWAAAFSTIVIVASVLLARQFTSLHPPFRGSLWPIPGFITLFGFALRFLRILRKREMLWGIAPIEVAIFGLAGVIGVTGGRGDWLSTVVVGLILVNLLVVAPWVVGVVIGNGLHRESEHERDEPHR